MLNDLNRVNDDGKETVRKSVNLLPVLFRTDKNSKFLSGTIDQLIQTPQLKRIEGWVGSRVTPTNTGDDIYLLATSKLRQDYQLEPSLVINNSIETVLKTTSYDDFINQLAYEGANTSRLDRLLSPDFYSYNPRIDWDKFVNFEKYYWLPFGPDAVTITSGQKEIASTYNISDTADGFYFIFTPDGLTPSPQITLFRGVTYKFNVNSKNPFWIKTVRIDGTEAAFRAAENNGVSSGTITLSVDFTTPVKLYFVSENDKLNGGEFIIKNIDESTAIDVEKEIIGKVEYISYSGVNFTNGLKIKFIGDVTPAYYKDREFIVEGVGSEIKLIDFASLETPESYANTFDERFDAELFDSARFDQSNSFPQVPEYITINRSSKDRNYWSRYNRWFHEDVIQEAAKANKNEPILPPASRAKRPIIEFNSDLKLYNFGSFAKPNVQHIDDITSDAFSEVNGQLGYYVDGTELGHGDRVIFLADTDPYVRGKTYYVNFVKIKGEFRISLEEAEDFEPLISDSILVTSGDKYKGTQWWFNGKEWNRSQEKTVINQPPLFDVFDADRVSYSDQLAYKNGTFQGTRIFGYSEGTGVIDPVLGISLKYRNVANQAYYLFENYFSKDINLVIDGNNKIETPVEIGFLKKVLSRDTDQLVNIWDKAVDYRVPIIQYNVIDTEINEVEITSIKDPGFETIELEVFVNNKKQQLQDHYTVFSSGRRYFVVFKESLKQGNNVLFKIRTDALPSETGFYETSLGWVNNPLNESFENFTLSELAEHVKTMADRHPEFQGTFPGNNNLRDITNLSSYGTRMIINRNSPAFASYFIANDQFNALSTIRVSAQHYNQFKLNLLDQISKLSGNYTSRRALDIVLYNININKEISFPYSLTDMVPYGTDAVTRNYTVTDSRNTVYSLIQPFDNTVLSTRAVIVYHTNTQGITQQLLHGKEYEFNKFDPSVTIKISLEKGDQIIIDDYSSTEGCYIPPTPTKLGLFPKSEPKIFIDDSYLEPQKVIQGHDGSIMLAFNDYRDDIILEYEKRVYNNLKVHYNSELINIHQYIPGAFRKNRYTQKEINKLLSKDFLKWTSFYGFDFFKNEPDLENSKTWNFKFAKNSITNVPVSGSWRSIFKLFYDTDRPHTHPWEMLGFSEMPTWWEAAYGPAPYTSGNTILWSDIESGLIKDPANTRVELLYARPGLLKILPVDEAGSLLKPEQANLVFDIDFQTINSKWNFGDEGPVETAWRRSSFWPFAVQIMLALADPLCYSSKMFDVSRMVKNSAGQYVYSKTNKFISLRNLEFYSKNKNLAAGYSVMLIEAGKQKNKNYLQELENELKNVSFKLAYKLGGFINKEKFKIIIDSVSPTSASAGVAISNEDYSVFLDKSSPVKSIGVSGVIVEKISNGYLLKGYDIKEPYFNVLKPVFTSTDPVFNIGGKQESFVEWVPSAGNSASGFDLTSVSSNSGFRFYKQGQIVRYQDRYYRVKVGHNSSSEFNLANFQSLPALPLTGGVTVRKPARFEKVETQIPYGTEFTNIEEVYAILIGYGEWLKSQGLIFDQYNKDLGEIFDWFYSSKEFLFWTTQKWAIGSVITLSPFAEQLKFVDTSAVVDSIVNPFYEYSVLKADGSLLSNKNISTERDEEQFIIATKNTTDGLYFVRLNLIQKEHTIVLNNKTLFNDVIYDSLTGYKQRRVKLIGFVTDNWNGDIFSPGFIYDEANISTWTQYQNYSIGEVVFYAGNYYSANEKIVGSEQFNFNQWNILGKKPVAELLPNFDYKINEFENFYSLDIDNFDQTQQDLAQRLTGYTRRIYLDNIFINPTTQYKFYQGYIREKGTKNTIDKLGKASVISLGSYIDLYEDWAFRVGNYGSFETNKEIEFDLKEEDFKENPQIFFLGNSNQGRSIAVKNENNLLQTSIDLTKDVFSVADNTQQYKLPVAGYVKLDDVTATAFNKDSLLDIANNRNINEGSTFWVGFENNGDWGVYRYTKSSVVVVDAAINVPGDEVLITTNFPHRFAPKDIISISQFDSAIDGIYEVSDLVSRNQFTIKSPISEVNLPFVPGIGLIFKFVKVRFNDIQSLKDFSEIDRLQAGEKIWIDNINEKWATLEKSQLDERFLVDRLTDNNVLNQSFGFTVATDILGNSIAVAAPNFVNDTDYGKVYLYNNSLNRPVFIGSLLINPSPSTTYFNGMTTPMYGASINIEENTGYVISSAPSASNVKWGTEIGKFKSVITENPASLNVEEGLIKFNKINFNRSAKINDYAFASPEPQAFAKFGHDTAIGKISSNQFILIASAPGQDNEVGAVYFNKFTSTEENTLIAENSTEFRITNPDPVQGSKFGYSITSANLGKLLAIASPGQGKTFVYSTNDYNHYELIQTLSIDDLGIPLTDQFGTKVVLDSSGDYLYISAPAALTSLGRAGKVFVYKNNNQTFSIDQIIENPLSDGSYNFGLNIAVSPDGQDVAVSSIGSSVTPITTFDNFKNKLTFFGNSYTLDPLSGERPRATTFDSKITKFITQVDNAGIVAVFERMFDQTSLIYADAIKATKSNEYQQFGRSVAYSNKGILAGAPGADFSQDQEGYIDVIRKSGSILKVSETQNRFVDIDKIKNVKIIDIDNDQIVDYLEIIDPINGKIAGIAEQEIRYKTLFDPATYSIGVAGLSVNSNSAWLDEHVGELWWDLSSVKFVNYNQGDLESRRNNWNKMFPGSMIDVYEWVKSPFLPAQWAEIADTNQGLAQGISGQPKFVDNAAIAVKQVWNPTTNSFSNVYYYWVKNKVTLPEFKERKISAYDVATLIADPKSQGVKFVGILTPNALMVTNIEPASIIGNVSISVEIDTINNKNNKHTEWLLIQDGNPTNQPPLPLVTKIIDSLVGRDQSGNVVPDASLTARERYGIGIRPRQTIFKNREGALRTFAEYTNSILRDKNIVGSVNLERLFEKEIIPNIVFGEYDLVVEDLIERDTIIKTKNLRRAILDCDIIDGKINSVRIVNPGFGYGKLYATSDSLWKGPVVTIAGTGFNAVVETEVDTLGRVALVKIINKGSGYTTKPELEVRPHSYIVTTDNSVNGKWSKYEWNYLNKIYVRVYSQSYNTQDFWNYTDWVDPQFNDSQDIIATIDAPFQLPALTNVVEGNYIKVRNIGDGRFAILRKVPNSQSGTYNVDYDLVYQENGTIQIKDSLWNFAASFYGWDQEAGWDQTSFDQTPSVELLNIIRCIFENVFTGSLKVYKNKLFFKLVKYALSEQKFVDWALKTSFINVTNYAGQLDQRPVYKLNNETYYQNYVDEVKPYHTKVRNFAVNYTATDVTSSVITDFDSPSYYDISRKQYVPVTFGNNNLLGYPWRSWFENYTYGVEAIEIFDGGSDYDLPPDVEIIAQPGDTGFGAKAVAYIALGKVSQIVVTDPGTGYTVTPLVNLIGGGSTILTPAKVSVRLANNKVRSNKVTIKFDRVSGYDEVRAPVAYDKFTSDGITNTYKLTWAPSTDKTFAVVKINGVREISSNYELVSYKEKIQGYSKKFGNLILNKVYPFGTTIDIEYRKDVGLYNAIDRIRDYYHPTAGMPGNEATLLLNGLEYQGTTLDTLPFEVSKGFDTTPFGTSDWDDYLPEVGYFATIGSTTTSVFRLPYVPKESQKINIYINGTRTDGTGTVQTLVGDGFTNEFDIGTSTQATDLVEFRLESSDGTSPDIDTDLDTYINPNGPNKHSWYYDIINGQLELTKSNDYEDINIDGDGFVTRNNSYGPEENLPGKVSDTLGMNVFTYPESGTALVVNKKYIKDPAITRYSIGYTPASLASMEVMLDNKLLTNGVEYLVDYSTNEIELEVDTFLGIRGPYFSPEDALPGKQGTPIASDAGDDTFTGPYPLGFQWNMFGTLYDQIYVGTNGYLTFGGGSSKFTPLILGELEFPAIYVKYTDLWQALGVGNTPLSTGETPGLYLSNGTVGKFNFWKMRFVGTHYNRRNQKPTVPAYQYEVTLYSDGINQYVEMIYENTWKSANFNGDLGFITGIARGKQDTVPGTGVQISYEDILNNTSHVFYSTSNGGNWQYAGRGSFDPFRNPLDLPSGALSLDSATVITVIDESSDTPAVIEEDWNNFRKHYPNRRFCLLQPQGIQYTFDNLKVPATFNNSFRATGPLAVNRDVGNVELISDWFDLCGLGSLRPGSVVALAIDVSGSMDIDTVRASYDFFKSRVAESNLVLVEYNMFNERWAFIHDRPLPVSAISNSPQVLSITSLDVGGKNLLEKTTLEANAMIGLNNYELSSNVTDIKSSYITVNGIKVSNYEFVRKGVQSSRAILKLGGNLEIGDIIQIWLFAADHKAFSEIQEQVFPLTTSTREISLVAPPGNIAPLHNQIIVEKSGVRLLPPDTVYYRAENGNKTFSLEQHYDYPQGLPDRRSVEVYVNGVRKPFGKSVKLLQNQNAVSFSQNAVSDGDVIAITVLRDHDYYVDQNKLILTNKVSINEGDVLKIITFTNHDNSLIRRERFPGNSAGIFNLSRKAIGVNYVWVEVNGRPLTVGTEYNLAKEGKVVVLNDSFKLTLSDTVVIMSVSEQVNKDLLGFRIFYDNLGRSHYKRLSESYSTRLAEDLHESDKYITVEDASVLSKPNVDKNKPGIILINGERIEFFKVEGNKLSSLRRGTLGTGVKIVHRESSIVIDQGQKQTIPVYQNMQVWKQRVAFWNTGTDLMHYGTSTYDISASFENAISEEVEVYYEGKLLRKPLEATYELTDTRIAYDSYETNSQGVNSTIELDAEYEIIGGLLEFKFLPKENAEIKVVKRTVQTIGIEDYSMHKQKATQVNFLLDQPSFAPDKYYYGQNQDTRQVWVSEAGDTIDDESGSPIIGS